MRLVRDRRLFASIVVAMLAVEGCRTVPNHNPVPQCRPPEAAARSAPAGTPARVPANTAGVRNAPPPTVSLKDRELIGTIQVDSVKLRRLADNRAGVVVRYLNCTGREVQIEARTHFLDQDRIHTEDVTEWKALILPPRSRDVYRTQSVKKPDPKYLKVEVRRRL